MNDSVGIVVKNSDWLQYFGLAAECPAVTEGISYGVVVLQQLKHGHFVVSAQRTWIFPAFPRAQVGLQFARIQNPVEAYLGE